MPNSIKLSVVIPVRNRQETIRAEVERILEAVAEIVDGKRELIVVDDGSTDGTYDTLRHLSLLFPELQVVRHKRPRGLEAAGQTGLEKATGELICIQESENPLRLSDLRKLYEMSADPSIVAARAQSTPRPLGGPLLSRLKACGAAPSRFPSKKRAIANENAQEGLQLVRRHHLQELVRPTGPHLNLQANRYISTRIVPFEN